MRMKRRAKLSRRRVSALQPAGCKASHHGTAAAAFTLLEVMFAIVVFCTAMFSILALIANSLADARNLQRPMVDAGEVASILSQTNLEEGTYTENLGDLLGNDYNRYTCTYDVQEAQSNKLFKVDFIIQDNQTAAGGNPVVSKMSILLYSPSSQPGSLDGGSKLHL